MKESSKELGLDQNELNKILPSYLIDEVEGVIIDFNENKNYSEEHNEVRLLNFTKF